MSKKVSYIVIGLVLALAAIGSIAYTGSAPTPTPVAEQPAHAPVTEAATPAMSVAPQIIEIKAQHGYSPLVSTAKANTPTIIRMTTGGSFDCSSAVVIPSLNYHTRLPMSGSTDIEVPAQPAGTKLTGTCGMGMYSFEIDFVS